MPVRVPCVALVGRPNVGKSSLFNRLAGHRMSIVHDLPGVTRDRVTAVRRDPAGDILLVDTGGMDDAAQGPFYDAVVAQIDAAVAAADVVTLVVDARQGAVPDDARIARRLRAAGRPVVLVANKADGPEWDAELAAFCPLGWGMPLPVSAKTGRGLAALVAAWRDAAPRVSGRPASGDASQSLRLAVVGKRNAGKSTWVNALLGGPRMIVSDIPGTTRDAVASPLTTPEGTVLLVDTPGLRKRRSASAGVDFFSQRRGELAIEDADVVLLLLDGMTEISQVDKAIEQAVLTSQRPVIVGVNKWDLVRARVSRRRLPQTVEEFRAYIVARLPGLAAAPIVFTSGKTGSHVAEVVALARHLAAQARERVPTSLLNRWVQEFWDRARPRSRGRRRPNLYFAAQTGTAPPTIRISVNHPALFDPAYGRRLAHHLASVGPWRQVPLRLQWVPKRP